MSRVELSYTFVKNENLDFENELLFNLRREIAQLMNNNGFGEIIENGTDKFANVYAEPFMDEYFRQNNELVVVYVFHTPLNNGDLAQLLGNIVDFQNHIHNDYENVHVISQVVFTD